VPKAILLLDSDGIAMAPATLCAESPEEAGRLSLPMFGLILTDLSAGKEIRANGRSCYELFEEGACVGRLEIFEAPASRAATDMAAQLKGRLPPEVP
jgi:hypothetical protein